MHVTVLTPTYNRAHTLGRLFQGLQAQTFRDFEWLIVDDGSSDGTSPLITQLRRDATFPVLYQRQPHAGKHIAVNTGLNLARGQLLVVLDSDDWLVPDGLATLHAAWQQIPDPAGYAEVRALCKDTTGVLVGDKFPADPFDTDSFELRFKHHIGGDYLGMWRTEILREFPFPNDFVGIYVLESLVFHRIARRYKTRCINPVVAVKAYQQEGISATNELKVLQQAGPLRVYNKEILRMGRPLPFHLKSRTYVLWLRFALLSEISLMQELRDAPEPVLAFVTLPLASLIAARDRVRTYLRRTRIPSRA